MEEASPGLVVREKLLVSTNTSYDVISPDIIPHSGRHVSFRVVVKSEAASVKRTASILLFGRPFRKVH